MPYLELEALPKARRICKMIMHIQSPCIAEEFFKHFHRYLEIFRDIDVYSATLTSAQLGRRGEDSPALFENRKKCSDFGKKGLDCVHRWVKFSIQKVV